MTAVRIVRMILLILTIGGMVGLTGCGDDKPQTGTQADVQSIDQALKEGTSKNEATQKPETKP